MMESCDSVLLLKEEGRKKGSALCVCESSDVSRKNSLAEHHWRNSLPLPPPLEKRTTLDCHVGRVTFSN